MRCTVAGGFALHRFSGRVVDGAGDPVAGAEVTVRSDRDELVSGRTGADGRFLLRGTMSGRHLCPCWWHATAVAGAKVGLSGRGCGGRRMRLDFGDVRLEPTQSIRVEGLSPRDVVLAVGTEPGWNAGDLLSPVAVPIPEGEPGSEIDLGEVVLPAVVRLSGRVVDESGGPVDAADVWALCPGLPHVLGVTCADEHGAFTLRIPEVPGRLLQARAPDDRRGGSGLDPTGEDVTIVVDHGGTVVLDFGQEERSPKVWIDGALAGDLPWETRRVRLRAPPGPHDLRIVAAGRCPVVLANALFVAGKEAVHQVSLSPDRAESGPR